MKNIIFSTVAAALFFTACNNSSTDKKADTDIVSQTPVTTMDTAAKQTTETAGTEQPASIKEIVAEYLKIKNAFANDNSKSAATEANEMVKAFANFNKKTLTAGQSKIYMDIEDDAKEMAEHIATNAGKIEHQREHFEMLSNDVYDLVKTFGPGQALYKDFCPMYNNNKGAIWLSETEAINNPYLGKKMPTCGTVKEELK